MTPDPVPYARFAMALLARSIGEGDPLLWPLYDPRVGQPVEPPSDPTALLREARAVIEAALGEPKPTHTAAGEEIIGWTAPQPSLPIVRGTITYRPSPEDDEQERCSECGTAVGYGRSICDQCIRAAVKRLAAIPEERMADADPPSPSPDAAQKEPTT